MGNTAHLQVAQWRHLEPDNSVAGDRNLNRVRLGDLIALVEVYFCCSWKAWTTPGARGVLTAELQKKLEARGFSVAELLVTRWSAACARRPHPTEQPPRWFSDAILHHPPMNGSYKPQPLPQKLVEEIAEKHHELAVYTAPGGHAN